MKEKDDTLFFIVHDEAHAAPKKNTLINKFVNDPILQDASNIILLQVSATPYCLVTKNSRIPVENRQNWFTTEDTKDTSNYFGVQNFITKTLNEKQENLEASLNQTKKEINQLKPGTIAVDETFEENIQTGSKFQKYLKVVYKSINKKSDKGKNKTSDLMQASRVTGLILQYMKAFLKKAKIPSSLYEKHFEEMPQELSEMTETMIKDIDSKKGGKGEGKMILLRVLNKKDGQFFAQVLRKIRKLLKMEHVFSVVLDLDETKSGLGEFSRKEKEEGFLKRLQCWNYGGNPRYRPSSYIDLNRLPVILIVCEKGRMGITYPPSLRWYDLRLRYSTISNNTRAAIEQDLGRSCRYPSEEELPTILVSRVANKRLFPRKRIRRGVTNFALTSSNQKYEESTAIEDSNGVC